VAFPAIPVAAAACEAGGGGAGAPLVAADEDGRGVCGAEPP